MASIIHSSSVSHKYLLMVFTISVFYVNENIDYYRNYYNEAIQNAIAMVEEELKNSPSKDLYLDKVKF